MKYHAVTLEQVVRVVNSIGVEDFQKLSNSLPPANVKHGARTLGQAEAYLNMVEPTDLDSLLGGDATIKVEQVVKLLVDKNGRVIPSLNLKAAVSDPNRSFRLERPALVSEEDYANRLAGLHRQLGIDTGITAAQFKLGAERLMVEYDLYSIPGFPGAEHLRGSHQQFAKQAANLNKGVCLPLVLPKLDKADLGEKVEWLAEAVGKSYLEAFPGRTFNNHRRGSLAKQVSVVAGSRHEQLLEALSQSPVITLHFPNPLQGFSVNAQREQIVCLPEELVLSGVDTLVAGIMYPEILFRDYNTPGLDLAALQWQSAACSLYSEAGDDGLDFDYTVRLAGARGRCSGGLVLWKRRN